MQINAGIYNSPPHTNTACGQKHNIKLGPYYSNWQPISPPLCAQYSVYICVCVFICMIWWGPKHVNTVTGWEPKMLWGPKTWTP